MNQNASLRLPVDSFKCKYHEICKEAIELPSHGSAVATFLAVAQGPRARSVRDRQAAVSRTAKLHVMEVAELGSPVGSATPKIFGDPGTVEGGVW